MGGEAAKALTDAGVKTFAAGEQIAVVYENTSHNLEKTVVTLTAGDITNSGKTANISVTMTNPESNGTLRIIYPAAMAGTDDVDYSTLANQDGTLSTLAANLDLGYYSGTLDGENLPASPALSNPLAVCEFTIKNSDGSSDLTSGITMLYIGDGAHSYYVTPSSASTIWVAMWPVASSQWLTFHATDGTNKYEKEITDKTLLAANMYHLGIKTTQLQEGATFGKFSIDGSNTVHFSQGNLQYDLINAMWSFMDHQWSTVETSGQNVGDAFYNQDTVSLFGWSADGFWPIIFGISTSTNYSDYEGSFLDWGTNNITNGGGANHWSTPSTDAWQYIFNTRSASTGRFAKAKLRDMYGVVLGIILFPDHYTHPNDVPVPTGINDANTSMNDNQYSAEQWAKMEAAGAVFLPAAGYRYGTDVANVNVRGYYWSSTADGENNASYLYFLDNNVLPGGTRNRNVGHSVRLVCE